MASSKKKWPLAAILIFGTLLLLLVVFPASSWFYLQRGLNYRIAALEELQEIGHLPADFALVNQSGTLVDTAALKGHVLVVGMLGGDEGQDRQTIDRLKKIHEQFDVREDVLFISHLRTDDPADLLAAAESYGILDTAQWMFLATPDDQLSPLRREVYHFEEASQVALLDTSLTVRKVYQSLENKDMGRLVEHIALIIPFIPDRDIIFRREKEK